MSFTVSSLSIEPLPYRASGAAITLNQRAQRAAQPGMKLFAGLTGKTPEK
jgi:hypothetical protein